MRQILFKMGGTLVRAGIAIAKIYNQYVGSCIVGGGVAISSFGIIYDQKKNAR